MSARRRQRGSDAPFVDVVTHVTYDEDTRELSTPDGHWDLVVMKRGGRITMLQTGLITRPVQLSYDAGDEYLAISFKPGVFLPDVPGAETVDRGIVLPTPSARSFALLGDTLEIPTFDNVEGLIARLVRRGALVRDEIVEGVVEQRPRAATPRSVQRHFMRALGVTAKQLEQIQRACQAVEMLRQGRPAVDVAFALGYADQPHLTRSLRRLMGSTPGEITGRPPRRG